MIPTAFVSDVAPGDWYLEKDVIHQSVVDGQIELPSGPGIGMDPDPAVVERYLVATYDLSPLVS